LIQNEPPWPIVEIETADEFDRRSKALTKKYRNLKADLEPLILALQSGETPGDILTGLTKWKHSANLGAPRKIRPRTLNHHYHVLARYRLHESHSTRWPRRKGQITALQTEDWLAKS
jgi:hypothetical protein